MGMRKDLILSQEEIQRRRDSSRNRINCTRKKTDSSLTTEDFLTVEKVESSFASFFKVDCDISTNGIDFSDDVSELIGCLQFNNAVALHLIKFCRSIDQFENLHADDRFILVKYNLITLFCILTCYRVKEPTASAEDRERQEEKVKSEIYILCNRSDYLYEIVLNTGATFSEIVENDRTLISLLLATFLFSKGLLINENEPFLKDSLSVYQAQSFYAKLLWNYMIKKHGEAKACQHFSKLMIGIFRAQSSSVKFREFLGNRMTTLDAVDGIAPLMQTILHIS
jgi:hypothetical protein